MRATKLTQLGICPACFGDAQWLRTAGLARARCPNCGERAWPGLKRLGQSSERAAVQGYLYPLVGERGQSSKRYSLVPDPVVTWLALAVLAGIAGNLSYDLVKAALRRITRERRKLEVISRGSTDVETGRITIGREVQISLRWSERELTQCEAQLRTYLAGRAADLELVRRSGIGLEVGRTEPPTSHRGQLTSADSRRASVGFASFRAPVSHNVMPPLLSCVPGHYRD